MKRLFAAIVGLCLIATAATAFYQSRDSNYNQKVVSGGGAAPFALDGTPQNGTGAAASFSTLAFSTTFTNDVIYIAGQFNGGPITGITGCGLTWTRRGGGNQTGNAFQDLWSAKASSALSSCSPTVTQTSNNFFSYSIFAFSGAHFAAPFDSNVAIPNVNNTNATPATCTTSNANDILVGAAEISGGTPPTGSWVQIAFANGFLTEYQIVSATQSALDTFDGTLTNGGGSVCDAIIQGP